MRTTSPFTSALPVSVPHVRLSDHFFAFPSDRARQRAARELGARFHGVVVVGQSPVEFTFTCYRDTRAVYAAQIIFWLAGQSGGFRLNSNGEFVSTRMRRCDDKSSRVIACEFPRRTQPTPANKPGHDGTWDTCSNPECIAYRLSIGGL